jgi:hypothetical protein
MSQSNGVSDAPVMAPGRVVIEQTRARQTEPPSKPFREILAGGVSVLMGGAQVATSVLAGPVLAAAVKDARVQATGAIAGAPAPGATVAGALPSAVAGGVGLPGAGTGAVGTTPGGAAVGTAVADGSDMATMQAMQRESQAFNMQLLALQEDVQQENRRFTTLSNVLRAKHDTAKAAVSNIRS